MLVWRIAQATSVVVALAVLATLVLSPALGLFITWSCLVPLVPVSLLLAPGVWRNLCPIAVLSQLPVVFGFGGSTTPAFANRQVAPLIAAVLLFIIVPLRLVVLNDNGPALAAFVLTVVGIGVVGTLKFRNKSAWCSSICPVLPVERLYGQAPLITVPHRHCSQCTACVRACYDLQPRTSIEILSDGAASPKPTALGLLSTPTGVFVAAFPGFVGAYFLVPAQSSVLAIYAYVAAGAAVSTALWSALGLGLGRATLTRLSAGCAAGLYYWFSVPSIAAQAHKFLGLPLCPPNLQLGIQAAFLSFSLGWMLQRSRRLAD